MKLLQKNKGVCAFYVFIQIKLENTDSHFHHIINDSIDSQAFYMFLCQKDESFVHL